MACWDANLLIENGSSRGLGLLRLGLMQLLDGYCLDLTTHSGSLVEPELAAAVYRLTCRTALAAPGFALLDLGPRCDSMTLRSWMVQLKDQLDEVHQTQFDDRIIAVWLGRFNQQITTKFHLDGGPRLRC